MVKIDLLSGFLGAGKTTFANLLLRYYMNAGLRPVYIVNEFGKTGLDADIIKADGFDAMEIEGGCICCSLKEDVATAVIEVIETFSPTNIVFEPSGIFIFDNFFEMLKRPEIGEKCEIGTIITVVDGVNFSFAKATYGNFIYNQIKNAPILLLSKLEKTTQSVDELIADVKNINPDALVISKIWSEWDTADFDFVINQRKGLPAQHHAHSHSNLRSTSVKLKEVFTQQKIDTLIDRCKSGDFGNLYRVKGIIVTNEHPVLLNIAVHDVTLTKFKGIPEPTLTFIGESVNEEAIVDFIKT
jgi:G3E family GTPase